MFTGQEWNAEVGKDFFQARYCSSVLGRFTSADPGNAGADLTNPQSWNGYAYVSGNPLANVDPTGQDGEGFWNSIGNFFSNLFGSGGCNADFCATGYSGPTIDPQNNAQGDLSFGLSGEFSSGNAYYQSGVTFFAQATAYKPVQTQSATVAPQKNDPTKTLNCVAFQAVNAAYPQSSSQKLEYGGFIVQKSGQSYYYTPAFAGSQISMGTNFYTQYNDLLFSLQKGYSVAGWYHDHPVGPPRYDPENFSGGDSAATHYVGGPGFLLTPTRRFLRLNTTGKFPVIDLTGMKPCG